MATSQRIRDLRGPRSKGHRASKISKPCEVVRCSSGAERRRSGMDGIVGCLMNDTCVVIIYFIIYLFVLGFFPFIIFTHRCMHACMCLCRCRCRLLLFPRHDVRPVLTCTCGRRLDESQVCMYVQCMYLYLYLMRHKLVQAAS